MAINSRKNKYFKIVIVVTLAILFLFFANFYSDGIKNFFYKITEPAQKFLWNAGQSQSTFLGSLLNVFNIKDENTELQKKNRELLVRIAELEDLQKENDSLRQALDLNLKKEFTLIEADIISKNDSQDSILVGAGSDQGAAIGMPAVNSSKVLFGRVSDVYKDYSRVELISADGFSCDAKVQEKNCFGVAKGKGGYNLYLDLASKDAQLSQGDVLTTSNLGGVFPKNLLVGQIDSVYSVDAKPFQTADVKLFFDLNSTDTLFLISNFKK